MAAERRRACWAVLALGLVGCQDLLRVEPSPAFLSVAAGGSHTCAIATDGTRCWGQGDAGQLGRGSRAPATTPVRIDAPSELSAISAGLHHTCGLDEGGAAYCWGMNTYGQLGDGSTLDRSRPVAVAGGHRFSALDAGWAHTCGVTLAGEGLCWGRNDAGQLGRGTLEPGSVPAPVAGGRVWTAIAAGDRHTCGIDPEGRAWCWGDNALGQLGNGGTTATITPGRVSGAQRFARLSSGSTHTCGLTTDARAFCWGSSTHGELGALILSPEGWWGARSPVEQRFGLGTYVDISAGVHVTCAVTSAQTLECWGRGATGIMGDPRLTDWAAPRAIRPPDGATFTAVSVSSAGHACALARGGGLYCWGSGPGGELGLPSTGFSLLPARVTVDP